MFPRIAVTLACCAAVLAAAGTAQAVSRPVDVKDKKIAKLVEQLGGRDASAREDAVKQLTDLGPAALPALRKAAGDSNKDFSTQAEQVIKAIGEKAAQAVSDRLAKHNAANGAAVRQVGGKSLARVFPGHLFYAVIFRQYPISRLPPAPFKVQNIFVADKGYALEHLKDVKGLEKFFRTNLRPVQKEAAIKDVTRAMLSLAPEFHQDGFYRFSIPKDAVTVAEEGQGKKATGKSVVMPTGGNGGAVQVTLTFDSAGKLEKVTETAKLRQGIRPICQATRLLDPDSMVRRMAEKDILVMGRAARDYLNEQRAKARPELKKAIDRLWKRILDEGW